MSNETRGSDFGFTTPAVLNNLLVLVGVVGFTFNLLVCVTFLRRCMRKSYARHYFISLAFGDMLYCVSAIIKGIPGLASGNKAICVCYQLIDYCGYYGAMSSMILLASERLCAIRYPSFFKRWTKKRNIRIQIASIWLISFVVTLYPMYRSEIVSIPLSKNISTMKCVVLDGSGMRVYHLIFDVVLPIVLVLCFSVCTIHALKKRSAISIHPSNDNRSAKSLKKPWLQLTFILVMFCICFGPFFVSKVLCNIDDTIFQSWIGFIFDATLWVLTFFHTWLNPIMLWVCDTQFQEVSKRTFCRKCTKSDDNHELARSNTTT